MIRRVVYAGGREAWRFLMRPGAAKGSTAAVVSRYAAAVVMGLISWWAYTHR